MAGSEPGAVPLKTTPLRAFHEGLGARFTPFAGFEMPLQFEGILAEHRAVRESAGLFDVSHMSNLEVPAEDAEALAGALGADVTKLAPGHAKYTVCLRPDGTILDDLIVSHLGERFHVVPNAGMNEPVAAVLREAGCLVSDITYETCILAVQGPRAAVLAAKALPGFEPPGRFEVGEVPDGRFASGTGYTGEPGFELFLPVGRAEDAADALVKAGVVPCGLGARDTLRLEKGYALAGNEFDPPVTPVEARLLWTVDLAHAFVGRDAVAARKAEGASEVFVGLKATGKGIPRRGAVVSRDGAPAGRVSSGTMSPSLGVGIALAYVAPEHAEPGTSVTVDVRGRALPVTVEKPPFV